MPDALFVSTICVSAQEHGHRARADASRGWVDALIFVVRCLDEGTTPVHELSATC